MTPKEKAIELLNKINNMPITIKEWNKASDYAKTNLKRKALIVVDEVLNAIDWYYYEGSAQTEHNYWKEVKQEIEKL